MNYLLSIQEAANILGVSTKTLRRWDKADILVPTRTQGNQRRYAKEQIISFKNRKSLPFAYPSALMPLSVIPDSKNVILSETKDLDGILRYAQNDNEQFQHDNKNVMPRLFKVGILVGVLCLVVLILGVIGFLKQDTVRLLFNDVILGGAKNPQTRSFGLLSQVFDSEIAQTRGDDKSIKAVLQASTIDNELFFNVNIPSKFAEDSDFLKGLSALEIATLSGGIITDDQDIDVGTGTLTASNVLYGATAGTGISVGAGQIPTIANTDPGSSQNIFKTIKVGSSSFSSGSNTDTLELSAGSNITLSTDTSNKKVTITGSSATSVTGWTDDGTTVRLSTSSDNVGIGTTSPSTKLDVVGSATVSANLGVGGFLTVATDSIGDLTGNGLTVSSGNLLVNLLTTADGTGSTTSNSGFEFQGASGNQLTLLQGCSSSEILKWDDTNSEWDCAVDAGGGSAGIINVESNDSAVGSSITTLDFNGDFTLSESPSGEANISLLTNYARLYQTNGSIYPANSTVDLLWGAASTASAKFAVLNVNSGTPTATISANSGNNATFLTGLGNLATTNSQTLTIGGATTGNVTIDAGVGNITLSDSLTLLGTTITGSSLTTITGAATAIDFTEFDVSASTGEITINDTGDAGKITIEGTVLDINSLDFAAAGLITSGGSSDLTLDAAGSNILLSDALNAGGAAAAAYNYFASDISGVSTPEGIADLYVQDELEVDGTTRFNNVTYTFPTADGSSNFILTTNGTGTLSWQAISGVDTANYWRTGSGAISPINDTFDVLVGSSATTSAKFAVLNVNSGTPTASISAGASSAGAAYLTSAGTLSTTQMQTLTLGGSTTGNVTIDAGVGNITLSDSLTLLGTTITASSLATFTTAATLGMASTTTLNCTDCIDFDDMEDTLDVDAATDINLGANNLSLDLTTTGVLEIRDVATTYWTFDDDSTVDVVFPAAGTIGIDASTTANTTTGGVIDLNVNAGDAAVIAQNIDFIANTGITAAVDEIALNINLTQNDADADMFGLKITQAATGVTIAGTDLVECFICLENQENQAAAVSDAIRITSTAATAGSITTGLDFDTTDITTDIELQNGETIDNNVDGTISMNPTTLTLSGTTTITASSLTLITGGATAIDFTEFDVAASTGGITINDTGDAGNISIEGTVLDINSLDFVAGGTITAGGTGNIVLGLDSDTVLDVGTGSNVILATDLNFLDAESGNLLMEITDAGTNGTLNVTGRYDINGTAGVTAVTATCVTTAGGIVTGTGACDAGSGGSKWTQSSGALFPNNSTVDLLIGATSTASAKFAVLNVNSGTPTASVSANSGNNATYLTGLGNLATTNMQTLTLGGSTTGNVTIDAGVGDIILSDNLTLSGTTITASSLATFTTAATLGMASTTTLNCGDCIDFDDMKDTMTVDAATDIDLGGNNLSIDLTTTGVLEIRDVATAYWTFDDDSTVDVLFPAAGTIGIDASTTANTTTGGVIDLNVNAGDAAVIASNIDFIANTGITAAVDEIALNINLTQNDADADMFGLKITQAATAVTIAGTDLVECFICLENQENQAAAVSDAIRITSTAATAGSITTGLDFDTTDITTDIELQNGETIDNNVDGTISMNPTTLTLSGTTTITASSLATFTTAATLGMASTTTLNCGDCIDWDDMSDAMTIDTATTIASTIATTSLDLNVSPAGTATTVRGLEITPTFGIDATNQSLTGLYIDPNTNGNTDSGDFMNGILLNDITGTAANEDAIDVGSGYDLVINLNDAGKIGLETDLTGAYIEFDDLATDEINFINAAVGINTSTPASGAELDVAGQVQVDLNHATSSTEAVCGTSTTEGDTDSFIDDCTTSVNADYMEMYSVEQGIEVGDIVVSGSNYVTTTKEQRLVKLAKSATSYQKDIIGIISDPNDAGDFNSIGYNIKEEDNPMPVALAGRVKVKVSLENGQIAVGDPIASSSIAGVGMKATRAGQVIGKALEAFTCTGTSCLGKIMVFVNLSWYDPSVYITADGNLSGILPISNTTNTTNNTIDASSSAQLTFDLSSDPLFKDLTDRVSILEARINSLIETSLSASTSAILSEIQQSSTQETIALSNEAIQQFNNATISGSLMVLGRTTVNDLGVTGNINSGLLTINGLDTVFCHSRESGNPDWIPDQVGDDKECTGATLNTLSGNLYLQNLGLGGIDILAGKVTIDTKGNIVTQGEITAKKVNIDESDSSSKSVGDIVIKAGETEVEVKTTSLTSKSHIFATPEKPVAVGTKKKDSDTFTITLKEAELTDVKVSWWVVN